MESGSKLHHVYEGGSWHETARALLTVQTELTALLAGSDHLESVAPEILRALGECLRWDAAVLWIADRQAGRYRPLASRYRSGVDDQGLVDAGFEQSVPLGHGEIGAVGSEWRPRALADLGDAELSPRLEAARARGLGAGAWIPIAAGGELFGVLELLTTGSRELDPEVLDVFESLGKQLGQFIGRLRARAELLGANERMERVLESVGDGVLAVDRTGRIELANARAQELLGADRLLGRPVAEELRLVDEKSGRPIPAPEPGKQRRVRYRDAILLGRSGKATFVDVTWSPMVDARGRPCGMVAALSDVTDRRLEEKRVSLRSQAVEVLESSLDYESTLQRVAELAAAELGDWCGVFLAEEGHSRRVATACSSGAGAAVGDLYRRVPDELSPATGIGRVIRTGRSELDTDVTDELLADLAGGREELERLGGAQLPSCIAAPLSARGRVLGVLILISHDPQGRFGEQDLELAEELADRAASAITIAQKYAEAEAAVAARDEFVSIVSHELKSPLATLDFSLQAMERFDEDEYARRTATLTRRHVGRIKRLIDNLLETSRIHAGRLSLELEPCDLAELVRESAERLRAQAEGQGCELRISAAEPTPGMWDPLRIEQILSNLIGNAIKYGKGEPIDVVLDRDRQKRARLSVRDRGIGIDEKNRERIFGRFERSGRAADARSGVGLGLWIVRRTVDAMGGEIAVDSRPGQGAEFRVTLPIEAEHKAAS